MVCPKVAIWPIGTVLTRKNATVRHQVDKGNDGNIDVNGRISSRFIIDPEDFQNKSIQWIFASGFDDSGNNNWAADFVSPNASRGCASVTRGGRKWRLPTQRELQLMWLLKQGINQIYTANKMDNGECIGVLRRNRLHRLGL